MIRMQSVLKVTILLDSVPGWGSKPEDHVEWLQKHLDSTIPHYKPKVKLIMVNEVDTEDIA